MFWKKALLSTAVFLLIAANGFILTFAYKLYNEKFNSEEQENQEMESEVNKQETKEQAPSLGRSNNEVSEEKNISEQSATQFVDESESVPQQSIEGESNSNYLELPQSGEVAAEEERTITFNGVRLLGVQQGESRHITTIPSLINNYIAWDQGNIILIETKEVLWFDAFIEVTGYKNGEKQFHDTYIGKQEGSRISTPIHDGNAYLTYLMESGTIEQGYQKLKMVLNVETDDTANDGWVYHIKVVKISGYRNMTNGSDTPSVAISTGNSENPVDEFAIEIKENSAIDWN